MDHSNCRFCKVSSAISMGGSDILWDRPLVETDHFFVVPSLGALVEGWLLVVTKKHYLSMGALEIGAINELDQLISYTKLIAETKYGATAVFEHGPVQENLPVGCGVDHAHVHIVPTAISLAQEASYISEVPLDWSPVSGINATQNAYLNGSSYLYIEQDKRAFLHTGDQIPSQLFRKVIATNLGIPDQYNWREHSNYNHIAKTVEQLAGKMQTSMSQFQSEARK